MGEGTWEARTGKEALEYRRHAVHHSKNAIRALKLFRSVYESYDYARSENLIILIMLKMYIIHGISLIWSCIFGR